MTQFSNQFGITAEKGDLTLALNTNVHDPLVSENAPAPLVPGDAVVIEDAPGKTRVIKATAITDDIHGFVVRDIRTSEYPSDLPVKVAFDNSVMYMEASGAIPSGSRVEIVLAGSKIATAVGGSTIGRALEQASADGDIIPVQIFRAIT